MSGWVWNKMESGRTKDSQVQIQIKTRYVAEYIASDKAINTEANTGWKSHVEHSSGPGQL